MLRVHIDATSLLGPRSGVGRVTAELLTRLAGWDDVDLRAFAVTWRGRRELPAQIPRGVRIAGCPLPARLARAGWSRSSLPRAEWFLGDTDVVHGPNFVVPPASRAATVVTVHDLTAVRFPELCTPDVLAYPELLQRAVRRGAWIHTVSHSVADEVHDLLEIPRDRIVAIPNGPTLLPPESAGRRTTAADGRRLAGADRYLLFVGTVEPRKDLPGLVEAFDSIAGEHPDVRLVLAGADGWGTSQLAAALGRARARHRVTRLGYVDDEARAALLRGAAALVFPSLYEGFGLPVLEAMTAGTAVVATDTAATREVAGDAALLVGVRDVDALAGALVTVLSDDATRAGLVARGHRNLARFSWDRTAAEMVALYRRAACH